MFHVYSDPLIFHPRSVNNISEFYTPVLEKTHVYASLLGASSLFFFLLIWNETLEVKEYKDPFSTLLKEPQTMKLLSKHSTYRLFSIFFLVHQNTWPSAERGSVPPHLCASARLKAHFVHHDEIPEKDKSGRPTREGRWEKIRYHIHFYWSYLCETKEKIIKYPPKPPFPQQSDGCGTKTP